MKRASKNPVADMLHRKTRSPTASEIAILDSAARIRSDISGSESKTVNSLWDYVYVSKHSKKIKLAHLEEALKTSPAGMKLEIKKAISHLKQ